MKNWLFFNKINMEIKINLENDMKNIWLLIRLLFWGAFFLSIFYQMHYCWEKYKEYTVTLFQNDCRPYRK